MQASCSGKREIRSLTEKLSQCWDENACLRAALALGASHCHMSSCMHVCMSILLAYVCVRICIWYYCVAWYIFTYTYAHKCTYTKAAQVHSKAASSVHIKGNKSQHMVDLSHTARQGACMRTRLSRLT